MKIKRTALTRLDTGTGVTIGGLHVLRYALTRLTRGSTPITGQTLRVRNEYVVHADGRGVTIP